MLKNVFEWLAHKYPDQYDGGIPGTYLGVDVETTGASKEDLVVMLGHCLVEDRTPQWFEDVIINWFDFDDSIVPNEWLEDRLRLCQYQMEKKGNFHGVTVDKMREEGKPIDEALEHCLNLYQECRQKKTVFLGHCFLTVDRPRITELFHEFGGVEWKWYDDEILDTAALEKASVAGLPPLPGESVEEYLKRVIYERRSGIKFSLDLCVEKYQLLEKYDLDMRARHTAGFDAMLCHFLMEEFRELITRS